MSLGAVLMLLQDRKSGRLWWGCLAADEPKPDRPVVYSVVSALIMSSAAGMPGTIAVRSYGVQRAAVYQRRRPEQTAAYQGVGQNLETWLAQRRVGECGAGAGRVR